MNIYIAKWVFYSLEFLRHEPVYKCLKKHEAIQKRTKADIDQIQKEKLRNLVYYASIHNKYYRKKYEGYDVLNDFTKLPTLTKDELRQNYKHIVTTGSKAKLDLAKTSGSTGISVRFYRDRLTFAHALASKYAGHRWHGLDIGSKEARLWGLPIGFSDRLKTRLKDIALNRFRESEFDISEEVFAKFHKKITKKRPEYLYGYTSMIYEFAYFLNEKNIDGKHYNLKAVICTSESIPDYQRQLIEKIFDCRVLSEYGAAETGIISFECKQGNHHIMEDCIFLEVVNDENQPVKTGEKGKALVTVLNNFSSPIIRYDLGDILAFSDARCSCGISFSLLKKIVGRVSSVVVTPSGKIFHSLIFYYIMKEFTRGNGIVKQFKVSQKSIDLLVFQLVTTNRMGKEKLNYLHNKLKEIFGQEMKIRFEFVKNIERESSGKLRDFVSELDIDVETLLLKSYSQCKSSV